MKIDQEPGVTIHLTRGEAVALLDSLQIIFEGGFRLGAGFSFDREHVPTDQLRAGIREALKHP